MGTAQARPCGCGVKVAFRRVAAAAAAGGEGGEDEKLY